jgi:hypothetical protein
MGTSWIFREPLGSSFKRSAVVDMSPMVLERSLPPVTREVAVVPPPVLVVPVVPVVPVVAVVTIAVVTVVPVVARLVVPKVPVVCLEVVPEVPLKVVATPVVLAPVLTAAVVARPVVAPVEAVPVVPVEPVVPEVLFPVVGDAVPNFISKKTFPKPEVVFAVNTEPEPVEVVPPRLPLEVVTISRQQKNTKTYRFQ